MSQISTEDLMTLTDQMHDGIEMLKVLAICMGIVAIWRIVFPKPKVVNIHVDLEEDDLDGHDDPAVAEALTYLKAIRRGYGRGRRGGRRSSTGVRQYRGNTGIAKNRMGGGGE